MKKKHKKPSARVLIKHVIILASGCWWHCWGLWKGVVKFLGVISQLFAGERVVEPVELAGKLSTGGCWDSLGLNPTARPSHWISGRAQGREERKEDQSQEEKPLSSAMANLTFGPAYMLTEPSFSISSKTTEGGFGAQRQVTGSWHKGLQVLGLSDWFCVDAF